MAEEARALFFKRQLQAPASGNKRVEKGQGVYSGTPPRPTSYLGSIFAWRQGLYKGEYKVREKQARWMAEDEELPGMLTNADVCCCMLMGEDAVVGVAGGS